MNPTPFLKQFVDKLPPSTAIDIGCGNGRNALYLKQNEWNVMAVDSDQQDILEVPFKQSRLEDLSLSKQYGLVICLMVLHFLETPSAVNYNITKLQELTQDQGYLMLSAFTNENENGVRPYLFSVNEIEIHFKTWKLIQKQHELANPIMESGKEVQYWVVRYLFQKI